MMESSVSIDLGVLAADFIDFDHLTTIVDRQAIDSTWQIFDRLGRLHANLGVACLKCGSCSRHCDHRFYTLYTPYRTRRTL